MDIAGQRTRRSGQRPIIFTVTVIMVVAVTVMYLLVGKHLTGFDEAATTLTRSMAEQAGRQAEEMRAVLAAIRNDTRQLGEHMEEASQDSEDRARFLAREMANSSRALAATLADQGAATSTQLRDLVEELSDVKAVRMTLRNQTVATMSTLRAQIRAERALRDILTLLSSGNPQALQVQGAENNPEAAEQLKEQLKELLRIVKADSEAQQSSQVMLERVLTQLKTQAGDAQADQEKTLTILKAIVAHLRSQEANGGPQAQEERTKVALSTVLLEMRNRTGELLQESRNRTAVKSLLRELRGQSSLMSKMDERLTTLEIGLANAADHSFDGGAAAAKRAAGGGADGEGGEAGGGSALATILVEVRKQSAAVAEVREKVAGLEEQAAGKLQRSELAEEAAEKLQEALGGLLQEVKGQSRVMGLVDERLSSLETKVASSKEQILDEIDSVRKHTLRHAQARDEAGTVAAALLTQGGLRGAAATAAGGAGGEGEKGGGGGEGASVQTAQEEEEKAKAGQREEEKQKKEELRAGGAGGEASTRRESEVDVTDPSSWKQHSFAGNADFMRFSGYRVGARQLAGVGIGTASMRSNASVDCRWVGRGGELHGNAEVIFPKEHQDVQYAVLLLHCTFSEDVPPDGGYMVAALAAQDFVLYREEKGQYSELEPRGPFSHHISMCATPAAKVLSPQVVREFVEFHRLAGVGHFVLYDAGGLGGAVSDALEREIEERVVEVTDFRGSRNFESHSDVLALHDCIYKSRYGARWVMFLDFNEFIWVAPPHTLRSLLHGHEDPAVPWLSHGSLWWSSRKCLPEAEVERDAAEGAGEAGGDHFMIERMPYRWPSYLCHDARTYPDHELCLGEAGNRKLIADPRQIRRLGDPHMANQQDNPGGVDLRASVLLHNHYQDMLADPPLQCSEEQGRGSVLEWWSTSSQSADFARRLRRGHKCDFKQGRCEMTT